MSLGRKPSDRKLSFYDKHKHMSYKNTENNMFKLMLLKRKPIDN